MCCCVLLIAALCARVNVAVCCCVLLCMLVCSLLYRYGRCEKGERRKIPAGPFNVCRICESLLQFRDGQESQITSINNIALRLNAT